MGIGHGLGNRVKSVTEIREIKTYYFPLKKKKLFFDLFPQCVRFEGSGRGKN